MDNLLRELITSWTICEGVNCTKSILEWIDERNSNLGVAISRITLDESEPWHYDESVGSIINRNRSFFSICGIQQFINGSLVIEQPIMIQDEIGFLGIICRKINGVLHFLMQAKIEPGNINKIQISPSIQATKSNFTQKHGGSKPAYLDYFIKAKPEQIIVDQIQSEQSSRFFKKRNRNVILKLDEPISEPSTHRWMTLGQIKALMRYDNLVNMDTRTVLSCIPFALIWSKNRLPVDIVTKCKDRSLLRSLIGVADQQVLTEVFHTFNNYKMFSETETRLIDLYSLKHWRMKDNAFECDHSYPFRVIFCNISIEGREVRTWAQPLFEAIDIATYGLLCCDYDGIKTFLVHAKAEIGCFDGIELGPTVQQEAVHSEEVDKITALFFKKLAAQEGIVVDAMLSEEGGRFYHEQNRNVIIEIDKTELCNLPSGYFWSDYKTLNILIQFNNCLNIQLRNLLSLMEI